MAILRRAVPLAALLFVAAAPKPASLIRPITEADQARIQGMGCENAFTVGPRTYLFAMNHRMIVRMPGGAAVCSIDNSILDTFFEEGRPVTCGGVRLLLRQTARHHGNGEADSVSGPSSLAITQGTKRQILQGESGTAC